MEKTENSRLLNLFRKKRALLEGHFILSSGLHSDQYLQSALVLQDPKAAQELGKLIADQFPGQVDVVISPALGGLIIEHEVARAKGCRAIFCEKDEQGKPILRRGFQLCPKESALVVEDVITTGLSTMEVLSFVEKAKANLIGIGSLVSRSKAGMEKLLKYNKPITALLNLEIQQWDPKECPLCKKGIPAEKPGSRKK